MRGARNRKLELEISDWAKAQRESQTLRLDSDTLDNLWLLDCYPYGDADRLGSRRGAHIALDGASKHSSQWHQA